MKKIKKLLVGAMALMMAFSTVACGGGGGGNGDTSSSSAQGGGVSSETSSGETENSSETSSSNGGDEGPEYTPQNPYTLNVYSFTGGYGEDWLNALEERYKKERAGDEIWVNGVKYDGVTFKNTKKKDTLTVLAPKGEQYDVWFEEQVLFNQFVGENVFKDMTDVLTSDNPYEPGKTLESKMSEEQKTYYMRDGKYYGVPHYAGYVGIVYNKAMFDRYNTYFAKDYDESFLAENPILCMVLDNEDARTPGPDGIEGTIDDGLPTTYAEFYALCDVLSSTNKPMSWAGKHRHSYLGWFLQSLSASNESLSQAILNYTFDGTLDSLISVTEEVDGSPVITDLDDVELDAGVNGWKVAAQRGKYYALDFLETIVDNGWYTANSFLDVDEQTAAQIAFVEGNAINSTERPAMLVDGSWWAMEAKASFLAQEQGGVENPKDNYGWFPLPCIDKADAAARADAIKNGGKGYNLTDVMNSLCFIGSQVSDDVYKIAKDFVQFAYTDESLAEFSIITDTTKAVQYTMTEGQLAQMSAYGRSLLDMQSKANIVTAFSKNEFFQKNESMLVDYTTLFDANIGGKVYQIPVNEFKKGVSATTYFNGLVAMYEYRWSNMMV